MKKYIFLLILILISLNSFSQIITSEEAYQKSINFFEFKTNYTIPVISKSYDVLQIADNDTIFMYIVNISDVGWVLISGFGTAGPYFAYSTQGSVDINNIPPAAEMWLDYYKNIVRWCINNPSDTNFYQKDFVSKINEKSLSQGQFYLIQTQWDQEYPFNKYAPVCNYCDDNISPAGCTAIAMAQIMRYWVHPLNNYDWCNMNKTYYSIYTNEEAEAVAILLKDIGEKIPITYCFFNTCNSFGWPNDVKNALKDNFGYSDDIDLIVRKWHMKKWKGILRNELNNLRPIFYSGCKSIFPNECHSFICDGYDYDNINNFHFNFGWNGSCDGFYYFFDSIVPSDIDYNQYQKAIINIKPGYITSCNTFIQISESFRNLFIPISNVLYWTPLAGTINTALPPNNVIIKNGETATYSAYNEINLNEGFTAEAGSNFTAEIVQCPLDCKYPPVYINTMSILSEYYNYDEVNNMIIDTLINSEITISPNPFTDFIEIKNNIIQIDKIEIINMHSKVVYEKNNIGNSIYLGFLENGIYLLKIYTSDNIYVKKIIKQ